MRGSQGRVWSDRSRRTYARRLKRQVEFADWSAAMRQFRWREARSCVGSAEERPCVPSRASTDRRAHACARDGGARIRKNRSGGLREQRRSRVPSRASTDRRAHACARDGGARVRKNRNGGPCELRRRNDHVRLYRGGQLWKLWRTAQTEVGKLAEGPRQAGRGAARGETTALARPALGIASWQRGSPATAADEKNGVTSWKKGQHGDGCRREERSSELAEGRDV